MDRHIPLHCFHKHAAGAGIHAQEVYEKLIENEELNKKYRTLILYVIKALKNLPVVVENTAEKLDRGDINKESFLKAMEEVLREIRSMRQRIMVMRTDVRKMGAPFTLYQKDMMQELAELWGELWQMEKHFMEYLADIYIKFEREGGEKGGNKGRASG